jgi:DNA-binding LacI/PurR family transcriptional regulator
MKRREPTIEQLAAIAALSGVSSGAVIRAYTAPDRVQVATHFDVATAAERVGAPPPPPRAKRKGDAQP